MHSKYDNYGQTLNRWLLMEEEKDQKLTEHVLGSVHYSFSVLFPTGMGNRQEG